VKASSLIAVVGPTASGKTDLGITLARELDAEILSADSRQVYRHLDIGSAKPTAVQQAAVRHHLIDVADPDEPFDCARFLDLAEQAIGDIQARGKRVIVVGGTGLYLRVLRGGLFSGPGRDAALRAELAAAEDAQPGTLHARLRAIDPPSAARLHPNDRVRLIRALEVQAISGRPISDWQREHAFGNGRRDMRVIVLDVPRPRLYQRIDARCAAMLDAGLVDEVRRLYTAGYDPQLPALQSLGYREIGAYVRGECDLPAALGRMAQATRNFAKRQLTWFRSEPGAVWVPPEPEAVWKALLPLAR
jgi:tRNA dimethylallyltransferase